MGLLGWIRRHHTTGSGATLELHPPADPGLDHAATYFETCLAYGAWLLRQYDLARAAMRLAVGAQDPETGGACMLPGRTGPRDPQLLFLTCQLGMSAVLTGEREAAIARRQAGSNGCGTRSRRCRAS